MEMQNLPVLEQYKFLRLSFSTTILKVLDKFSLFSSLRDLLCGRKTINWSGLRRLQIEDNKKSGCPVPQFKLFCMISHSKYHLSEPALDYFQFPKNLSSSSISTPSFRAVSLTMEIINKVFFSNPVMLLGLR